jgi:hypothetical protein
MSPSDREAQLYPQAPRFLFVAFYNSQGYGACVLNQPQHGAIEIITTLNLNDWTDEDTLEISSCMLLDFKAFTMIRTTHERRNEGGVD